VIHPTEAGEPPERFFLDDVTTVPGATARETDEPPVIDIVRPPRQTAPVVFSSPHSGRDYPANFVATSRLDPVTLRRSEDSFVDELFGAAPSHGAPLLRALFPRAYVDPNREAFELDPAMFEDALPDYVNTRSARIAAGLGTVARVVASGEEIYGQLLTFADAAARIERYYRPYHAALRRLVEDTRDMFGACLLVDCHSMPSIGGPMDRDSGRHRVDFVLGDNHGRSCAPQIVDMLSAELRKLGYNVARNDPYSGGFTTREYGRPGARVHALQIEINRAIYMDETAMERGARMPGLIADIERLVALLAAIDATQLRSR
jgi:N-formylglutamate amidohydrolase